MSPLSPLRLKVWWGVMSHLVLWWRRPCSPHGRQRHWNIGGSQVERRRLENRGAVGGEGWGLGRGCALSQQIYELFISRWCDMVYSGCVVFKIHVSHGLQLYDKLYQCQFVPLNGKK